MHMRRFARTATALLIATAAIVSVPDMASAAQTLIYVNNSSPACSDSGSGAQAAPYCTISAAVSHVAAGETVLVSNGAYPEHVTIDASGTPTAPIMIAGTGSAARLTGPDAGFSISGSYVYVNTFQVAGSAGTAAFDVDHASDVYLDLDTVTNTPADGTAYALRDVENAHLQVTTTGDRGTGVFADAASTHNVIDGTFTGTAAAPGTVGVKVAGFNNSITATTKYQATAGIEISGDSDNVAMASRSTDDGVGVLLDGTATNSQVSIAATSETADGIKVDGASGIRIYDSVFTSSGNAGVEVDNASNVQVVNDTFQSNCSGIAVGGTATGVTLNNDVTAADGTGCAAGHDGSGIRVADTATSGTRADYNTVYEPGSVAPYAWGVPQASLAAYRAASGQGAHDAPGAACLCGAGYQDAADSAAPGYPGGDRNGYGREDDLLLPDTGSGPVTYADRGATEVEPAPMASLTVTQTGTFTVAVDASGTRFAAPVDTFTFDFGDGTKITQASPQATHTYTAAGVDQISVLAQDIDQRRGGAYGSVDIGNKFHPMQAVRVLDTHAHIGVTTTKPVAAHSTIVLPLSNIPSLAGTHPAAVMLNLGAGRATSTGTVTAYADSTTRPAHAALHFTADMFIQNLVVVPVTDGKIDFYNSSAGTVDVFADMEGYFDSNNGGAMYIPTGLQRTMDTLTGKGTKKISLAAKSTLTVPASVLDPNYGDGNSIAVAMNVQVTHQHDASGYLTVYSNSSSRPASSNIHWNKASTIANLVVVPVTGGKVEFYNGSDGPIDLVVDGEGEFDKLGDTTFEPITQTRAFDATIGTGAYAHVSLPGLPPDDVETTVITVTVLSPKHAGYLTVTPGAGDNNGTSHMHWAAGQTISETVFAWAANDVYIDNNGDAAEITVDVTGYFR